MGSKERLPIYIVIGTRAQFIKMAPLMRRLLDTGMKYTLIYTVQHRENIEEILTIYNLPEPDVYMYDYGESNTMKKGLRWVFDMLTKVIFRFKKYLPEKGVVLTHGDTFTAWLAALMGKMAGCKVAHVESGLRSHNIFKPFPEELSRLVTFALSDIYFCPSQWAVENLKRYKGDKINLKENPMLDGVKYALDNKDKVESFNFQKGAYAIAAIHRYENIFKPVFTEKIIPYLEKIARDITIVLTLHPTTRERLKEIDMYDKLDKNPNVILHQRFGFIDWINICNSAEFVITDGGSNQEELSYMGVPTILFRTETERKEGLEGNVVLSNLDWDIIEEFVKDSGKYRTKPIDFKNSPSQKIVDYLITFTVKGAYAS